MWLVRARTRRWRFAATAGAIALFGMSALPASAAIAAEPDPRAPGQQPFKEISDQVHDLTSGLTADTLARALLGANATISGATFRGDPRSAGLVSGFADSLGIDAGVALSSGAIATSADGLNESNLTGPNVSSDTTAVFGTAGDPDLDQLVAPSLTYDAAALEFDFEMPASDLEFRFVFGSEEYPTYAGSGFDDVFAFYLDGTNCATVSDPSGAGGLAPVSIDTINGNANAGLYRSNAGADVQTELNGLTTTLTCSMFASPGITHHLKLVVADTGDSQWDTDVVVEGATIPPNQQPMAEDQSVTTAAATATPITLGGQDPDGDQLTYAFGDKPAHGELGGTPPDVTYTAYAGFDGVDSFSFTVNDGELTSEPGNVAILVTDQTQSPPPTEPPTPPPSDPPSAPPTSDPPTSSPTETSASSSQPGAPNDPPAGRGKARITKTVIQTVPQARSSSPSPTGNLSGTGLTRTTPWLGAAGVSGAMAGVILIMTARRRLAR